MAFFKILFQNLLEGLNKGKKDITKPCLEVDSIIWDLSKMKQEW